jgi:hypothetical protein
MEVSTELSGELRRATKLLPFPQHCALDAMVYSPAKFDRGEFLDYSRKASLPSLHVARLTLQWSLEDRRRRIPGIVQRQSRLGMRSSKRPSKVGISPDHSGDHATCNKSSFNSKLSTSIQTLRTSGQPQKCFECGSMRSWTSPGNETLIVSYK